MADFPDIVEVVPDPIDVLVETIEEVSPAEVELGIPGPPGPPGTAVFDSNLELLYQISKL